MRNCEDGTGLGWIDKLLEGVDEIKHSKSKKSG